MTTNNKDQNQEEKISIYFNNKDKKSELLDTASTSEKYIILMNDTLQLQNNQKDLLIKEQELQIEDFEEEIAKDEKNIVYLKGLLKNFHEMNKWYEELDKLNDKNFKNLEEQLKINYKFYIYKIRILESILIFFLSISYFFYNFTDFITTFLILSFVIYFQEFVIKAADVRITTKEDRVKELKNKIQDTLKGQDYIFEFLDQQ